MNKIRVGINGFGRIGRMTLRALLKNENIEIVAINDLSSTATLAHLFKYDSVHGKFQGAIEVHEKHLVINDNIVFVYSSKEPEGLPWKDLNVDVIIESTGINRSEEHAEKHIIAGAKRVIISAPTKGKDNIKTVVLGINESILDRNDFIISNASCTTNCAAPIFKILDDLCGVETGFLSTVHAYTSDQRLHDAQHSDLRRARAAGVNIIPTTTGAAKTVVKVLPHLQGKLSGSALRVPVSSGSLTEFTCQVKTPKSKEEINAAFKKAAETSLKGILEYTDEPIVSTDIIGNSHSSIFDAELTEVNGNLVKLSSWYDNEAGYSNRLADLVEYIRKNLL